MNMRWSEWGESMEISENHGISQICKRGITPEYGVALTSPLAAGDAVHVIEVLFTGDCNYFAIGVSLSSIPLNESPRRLDRGKAWFLLNKGFLCDGRAFEDDSLDPIGV
jgi:hypothetical protein